MFWFLVIIFFSKGTMAFDYCSMSGGHTMCKYKGPGKACGSGRISVGVSKNEIEEIVRTHNDFRSKVALGLEKRGLRGRQPPAANMQKLIWDNDLAKVAQRWADQCTFQHDIYRDDPRFKVGQNIYFSIGYSSSINWTQAITAWYEEVVHFDPRNIDHFQFQPTTGHYTQLVWAKTHYIGCGRVSYDYGLYNSINKRNAQFLSSHFSYRYPDVRNLRLMFKREIKTPTNEDNVQSLRFVDADTDQFSNSSMNANDWDLDRDHFANDTNRCKKKRQIKMNYIPRKISTNNWNNEYWNSFYKNMKIKNHIYVCNYGPSGNFFYETVYIKGQPCSKCPPYQTRCFKGLCTYSPRQYLYPYWFNFQ